MQTLHHTGASSLAGHFQSINDQKSSHNGTAEHKAFNKQPVAISESASSLDVWFRRAPVSLGSPVDLPRVARLIP